MKYSALRWWIVALLFLAAILNYVDKNALALLAPTIQKDLGISDQGYAHIQNAFQIAYTIALLASGPLVDRFGPRICLTFFVSWWSLANAFTAFARSAFSLGSFRFLLGLGEAGNWAASLKSVTEWFPPKERGFAIGIYTAGTPIGMTVGPLLIILLADVFGWRSAFIVTGLIGLVWLVPWLLLYRQNSASAITEDGQQSLSASAGETVAVESSWTWFRALASVEVWCLMIGRMLSDPVWFFYQNWYPKYLASDRGLAQADIKIVSVIFLAAGIGSLAGGWIAGRLINARRSPKQARVLVMVVCALFMPLSPLVASASSTTLSLTFASLIVFMHLAWLTNITALLVDTVPMAAQGKVFSIVATGSSLGAIAMNYGVARMLVSGSYAQWFWIAAWLHVAVIPFIWLVFYRKGKLRPATNSST